MNNKDHIEQRIEDVMKSIDSIERATPKPFLHTRVMARLTQEKNTWSWLASFIAKPRVAAVGLIAIVLLNTFAVYNHSRNTTTNDKSLVIADEYNPNAGSAIENENTAK